jgi:hypothetical protein
MDQITTVQALPSAQSEDWQEQYAYSLGVQAYIYGFPWIYNAQLRWLWATKEGQTVSVEAGKPDLYAPINFFHYSPQLANPDNSQSGGSPNCDTLYSNAWLDVAAEPLVLSVPAVTDRFYCIEMVCMDADNFAYVGTRSTGTAAGNYLIAGPDWTGTLPSAAADVQDVLPRARTNGILLLGRTGVNNPDDVAAANAVQHNYLLTPLSLWPNTPPPTPGKVMVPKGVDYNHTETAWLTMNESMTQDPPGQPPGIAQDQLLALFATVGIGPGLDVSEQPAATRAGLQRAAKDGLALLRQMSQGRGNQVNGWTYPPLDIGRAGQSSDFITRGAVQSLGGICANDPQEAVYINASVDVDGEPLQGGRLYDITFASGEFPPCDQSRHGFWSVTLYDSDYNLVKGSLNYSVNGYYPGFQKRLPNGSMVIRIQSTDPGTLADGVYWLQSPADDSFYLILRVYVPASSVSETQSWPPPAIVHTP